MTDSYRKAGVDVEAGNALVDRIRPVLSSTPGIRLLTVPDGFAALSKVPQTYTNPVMVLGTDGVGTKLDLLRQHDHLKTVGQDLVAMCVNDLLVYGAEPALFLDYYATSKLDVSEAETVIKSIADACDLAGCALVGGETAEMPGFYPLGKFDLAGFCVGWVEEDQILHPDDVRAGNVIVGLASSGPHSNGFSLIRAILKNNAVSPGDDFIAALLAPTRIYTRSLLPLTSLLNAMAHITGGGFKDNLPRAFRGELEAHINLDGWEIPAVFRGLQQKSTLPELEMLATFNCGIGMTLFVEPNNVDALLDQLSAAGEIPYVIGEIYPRNTETNAETLIVAKDRFEFT